MPLALRKQAAVARADGNQEQGKGEGVQRLAGGHSRFMTVPRAAIPNCTLNVQLEGMSRKRDNRKKTTRFWQGCRVWPTTTRQGEPMSDTPDTRPVPSMKRLEASALQLIGERILSRGGKMPSEKALAMTVQALAAKAHRELTAQQKGE